MFYMNSSYLGQLFKNVLGVKFCDYINKKRIEVAKRLLRQSTFKTYEIIEKVGYANQEYFYREFKRYEGQSFAEYKNNIFHNTLD